MKNHWPWVSWMLLIAVLSFIPAHEIPSFAILKFDRLIHFLFYYILFALAWRSFQKQKSWGVWRVATSLQFVILFSTFGLLIEVIQGSFCEGRIFDWLDEAANIAGLFAAGYSKPLYQRKMPPKEPPPQEKG